MSWRAPKCPTSMGVRNDSKVPPSTPLSRTRTAATKSRQEDRGTRRELFIGWEGKDAYLQLEPITIEVWGKRSSKPKTVANTNKETKKDDGIHPKEFYFCWTYTKCSTIEDYDEFVTNSLGTKFKPQEDSNQSVEENYESPEGYQWKVSKFHQETADDLFTQISDSPCDENSKQLGNNHDDSCAISQENVNSEARLRSDTNSPQNRSTKNNTPKLIDVKSNSAFKSDSVLSLADSRTSTISQSSPNLRVLDKIEGNRRVSSAKSRRHLQNGASVEKDGVTKFPTKDNDTKSDTNDVDQTEQTPSKKDVYSNSNSDSVLRTCAQILETLRLSSSDDIGFDLPQTTHVSLGDLLSSTPRLQRRLGTARGRDPTVYAALHGNSPPPRPVSPDLNIKPKQSPRPPTPDLKGKQHQRQVTSDVKSKLNPAQKTKSGNKPDLIQDHARGANSSQERELPPVKAPPSPRQEPSSPHSRPRSIPPKDLPHTPPKDYSTTRTEKSANNDVGKRTMALLTYHKSSDTNGISCSSNPDVVSPDGSHVIGRPRMSENGDALRNNKSCQSKRRARFIRKALIASQVLGEKMARSRDGTRGPPGFRPQGQKTPLHRAMENAQKKLYGQHYHLFSSQANYGNTQQERQQSARSVSHRVPSARRQEPPSYPSAMPNQVEHRLKQTRSTTAPTRRMYHGQSSAMQGNKATRSEQQYNSMHNRKMSAPVMGENINGIRHYSDVNDNLDKGQVTLRGRPVQR